MPVCRWANAIVVTPAAVYVSSDLSDRSIVVRKPLALYHQSPDGAVIASAVRVINISNIVISILITGAEEALNVVNMMRLAIALLVFSVIVAVARNLLAYHNICIDDPYQGHSIQWDGKLLNFLLTSGLEHGPWRLAAAKK